MTRPAAPPPPAGVDLDHARGVAVAAVEAAGALLRDRAQGDLGLRTKGDAGDVVTDLDLAAERVILDRIAADYPDHRVVAEESGVSGPDGAWTWLVDPLDGSNNLAVGMFAYVVGVALCAHRVPVLGAVHDPVGNRTWSAARGGGASGSGGHRLHPGPRPAPHGPLLAWTQGHGVSREDVTARALKLVLESTSRRLLQLWAPLMSWVMLARGDIDGIVAYRAEEVDLPAGLVIATEAGMVVRALDGGEFDERIGLSEHDRSFVAGHPENIDRLLDLVRAARRVQDGLGEVTVPCAAAW